LADHEGDRVDASIAGPIEVELDVRAAELELARRRKVWRRSRDVALLAWFLTIALAALGGVLLYQDQWNWVRSWGAAGAGFACYALVWAASRTWAAMIARDAAENAAAHLETGRLVLRRMRLTDDPSAPGALREARLRNQANDVRLALRGTAAWRQVWWVVALAAASVVAVATFLSETPAAPSRAVWTGGSVAVLAALAALSRRPRLGRLEHELGDLELELEAGRTPERSPHAEPAAELLRLHHRRLRQLRAGSHRRGQAALYAGLACTAAALGIAVFTLLRLVEDASVARLTAGAAVGAVATLVAGLAGVLCLRLHREAVRAGRDDRVETAYLAALVASRIDADEARRAALADVARAIARPAGRRKHH
jgi:hypothetical protein